MGSSLSSPSSSSDESEDDDKRGELSIYLEFWINSFQHIIFKYPICFTLSLKFFLIVFSRARSYHNRWRILQRLSAWRTCDPMSSCVLYRGGLNETFSGSKESFVQNQCINNLSVQESGRHDTSGSGLPSQQSYPSVDYRTIVKRDFDSDVGGKDSSLRRVKYQSRIIERVPSSLTYIEQVMLLYQKYANFHKSYESAETWVRSYINN